MTSVYVTVDYLGQDPIASRPACQGCAVDGGNLVRHAEYKVIGASGTLALCRDCAIHSIKSLAARFVLFDLSATRDLMDFFSADAAKRPAAKKKRRQLKALKVIDVPAEKLLPAPRKSGGRSRSR